MKKTVGFISANYTSHDFGGLTDERSYASLPFGGRYRLIDFPLSNMVNSGINTVGVVAPYNFRSLLDHLGDGKSWDISRKVGGMYVLPGSVYGVYTGNSKFLLRDLIENRRFFERDEPANVLISGSNMIYNMDYRPLIESHEKSACPVTFLYKTVDREEPGLYLDVDENGSVKKIDYENTGSNKLFLDCMVVEYNFLMNFINWFSTLDYMDIVEIMMGQLGEIGADAYEFTGYVGNIETADDYMRVNMDLLTQSVHEELFDGERQIYTKVQDEAPVLYRPGASVKNSLIATGCVIEGSVENCIIARGVRVKKGAVLKNCIINQSSYVLENARVENVIADKYVTINPGTEVKGGEKPLIINKNQSL